MRTKKSLAIMALLIIVQTLFAEVGTWRNYLSYQEPQQAEYAGDCLFVLASNSLYMYNRNDQSITTYDKTNGMSDVNITQIAWNNNAKRLIAVYGNSNIDIISTSGEIVNLPDFYSKSMTEDKTVNSIYIYGKYAYLSTGFGIVKVNMEDVEISETYNLGFKVDYCYIEGSTIYAASQSNGIYSAPLSTNLLDKSNWQYASSYVAKTKTIDTETLALINTLSPGGPASNNFYHLYINNGKLYATGGAWYQLIDGNRNGEVHVWDGNNWSEFETPSVSDNGTLLFKDALCLDVDPQDSEHVMVGTKNGLFEFRNGKYVKLYNKDNSPLVSPYAGYTYTLITSLKYDGNGNLWVLNSHTSDAIKCLTQSSGQWSSYPKSTTFATTTGYYDLEKAFISDSNGLMWFVNNYYQNTLLCSYDYGNDKLSFYGPTLTNQDGTTVSANYIYSPVEDKEGNIWVCTDAGPLYLAASTISNGETYFTQYKVPRNDGTNYADYLLSGVSTTTIAIDGGNRKWFGTSGSGVFLVSADNDTQLEHFTTDNSPLLSNIITDIQIDNKTGEVYISTDKGLCSYHSSITEASDDMDKDNVYAYPNPVTSNYTGSINIVGLTYNADVKIVASNGALVNQGRSIGGTYTWDGCDLKGTRVASGVYLVITAKADGSKGVVCKIAVVR